MNSSDLYQTLSTRDQTKKCFLWEKKVIPFQELIIGWNAQRPHQGQYHISVSLKMEEWSPWFSYALWGTDSQRSFEHQWDSIKIFQDTILISEGYKACAWRMKVEAEETSNLQGFHALYAAIPPIQKSHHQQKMNLPYICLDVPGISQIKINDPRNMRICSPTSTTAVVSFLNKHSSITPLEFAEKVWDSHFDIYGHWVFAAAQAYAELGEQWICRVQYLNSFDDIYHFLQGGYPVVVSIKGPLPGSLHPYQQGHLLVVRGYDPLQNSVLCMDPAYSENSQTHCSYAMNDFLNSWQRRKNIAYIFERKLHRINIPIG